MKILIIQPWISYRGAETISVQQAYYLKKHGHQTAIAALFVEWDKLPAHGRDIDYILPHQFISKIFRKSRFMLFFFGPIALFILVIRNISTFQVINPHNLPGIWIAAIIGKVSNKKIIWTAHSIPERVTWREKKSYFEYFVWLVSVTRFDIWAVRQADQIIAVSLYIAKKIKKRYGKTPLILHNGITDLGGEISALPHSIKRLRSKSKLLLLQVGTLRKTKGQRIAVRALKLLKKHEPTATLILAGEGDDKQYLEELVIKLDLESSVHFAGHVSQDKIAMLYKSCDLNIIPSINESFASTPLEALTFNKISVISASSGVLDVIRKYAITCTTSPESLRDAVIKYSKNKKKYTTLAKEGNKFIHDLLNWDNYEKKFIEIVHSLNPVDVSPDVYSATYYQTHYENEHQALKRERVTRKKRAHDLLRIRPGMKVLDIGCGTGELCIELAKAGCDVYGIDYSNQGIELAKKNKMQLSANLKTRVNFSVMDAGDMKFSDNFFDRIVCIDVFEHIHEEPLQRVIQEMTRVIKPKGRIVLETAPNKFFLGPLSFLAKKVLGWKSFESDEYHVNVFDYFRLKQTLSQIPGKVHITVLNDSHQFLSSRVAGVKNIPSWIKHVSRIADFLHENPIIEPIVLHSPIKIFLAHDLWAVIDVAKKK